MITSWKDMPLGVYAQVLDINGLHISEDEKIIKITALLAGMKEEELMTMPLVDSKELIAQTHFLYEKPKTHRARRSYKLGKKDYILMRDIYDMTTAQYINYQAIVEQPIEKSISNLMAIVLIPEGTKYGDTNENDVIDDINNYLSVEDALSVADFFTRSFEKSIKRMLRYSDGMMTAAMITAKKEDKEMIKAARTELRLVAEALRSAFGWSW